MRTRVGVQITLAVGVVTAVTIGVMAAMVLRSHRREMIAELTRSADLLSETVKNSTHEYMLENRREDLRRQIETIGRQPGIVRLRLFNKEGVVVFSSDATEVGKALDTKAESCFACHAQERPLEKPPVRDRARVFRPDGARVLGIVNPIANQPSCWAAACHAHGPRETVLGVLDVTLSLAEVDRRFAAGRDRIAGIALLAIAATALILWWGIRRLVIRPVEALAAGTRRVAEGDLATTIPASGGRELRDLADAFNAMTSRLSEARRQLAQADKLASVGRLAAGVAHEINNPLTGVLAYASLLLQRAGDDPELKSDLEVIVRETRRCREIVRGLLDFARQTPPRRQPTDLNEVTRRAVAVVMNQLTLHHVALTLDLAADLPRVAADANQMQQVLVNLLLNAADAVGDRGGSIRVASAHRQIEPRGHEPIRRAACPNGCDLLDAATRIGGLPAIRVLRSCGGTEGPLFLDPIYGRFNHLAPEPCEEGLVAEVSCPRCRASLATPERSCGRCGAPTFSVRGPGAEPIAWCARVGCHTSLWEARERRGAAPWVEVAVEDDGRGIAREALPHLFEPFYSTKGARGTGLGLAITWGIVEGHGGSIDVDSATGRGTRFTVRLPLEPAAGRAAAAA